MMLIRERHTRDGDGDGGGDMILSVSSRCCVTTC